MVDTNHYENGTADYIATIYLFYVFLGGSVYKWQQDIYQHIDRIKLHIKERCSSVNLWLDY